MTPLCDLVLDLHRHLTEESPVEEATFVNFDIFLLVPVFIVLVLALGSED
jgi:hypothetical protein